MNPGFRQPGCGGTWKARMMARAAVLARRVETVMGRDTSTARMEEDLISLYLVEVVVRIVAVRIVVVRIVVRVTSCSPMNT